LGYEVTSQAPVVQSTATISNPRNVRVWGGNNGRCRTNRLQATFCMAGEGVLKRTNSSDQGF